MPSGLLFPLRPVDEADQQELLSFAQDRLNGDAERELLAIAGYLATSDDNPRVFLRQPGGSPT